MGRLQVGDELLLEVSDLLGLDGIQITTDTSVDDANLLSDWHGLVLVLFQQFGQTGTTGKELKIIVIAFHILKIVLSRKFDETKETLRYRYLCKTLIKIEP